MPLDDTNWPTQTEVDEATELLIRARGFVERGWCQNAEARDKNGNPVHPSCPSVVAWCMYGALRAAGLPMRESRPDEPHPAIARLDNAISGDRLISFFNDSQETVEPVLAVFDRAIAAVTQEHDPMNDPNIPAAVSRTTDMISSTTALPVRHVAEIGFSNGVQCSCGWRGSYREWQEHKKTRGTSRQDDAIWVRP